MPRIAHLADLHIGYSHLAPRTAERQNQRQADFEAAAIACADHLADVIEPDLVVIAGDLLHEPNPYPRALRGAMRFLERLAAADLEVVIIGGNHDHVETEGRYNALRLLDEYYPLHLYLRQGQLDIAGVRLHLVPYRIISRSERGRTEIQPFEFASDRPNVLVAHGYTHGIGVPPVPEENETVIPEHWITDPRFDLVCLGHVHHHGRIREQRPVFYSGSTERRNFLEREQTPGFYVHELSDAGQLSSTSILICDIAEGLPRPMIERTIDATDLTADETSKRVLDFLTGPDLVGAMARLFVQNVSPELTRSRARDSWQRAFRENNGFDLDLVPQTRQLAELLDIKFAKAPVDIGIALQQFIKAQQFTSEDEQARISELAQRIMDDAREAVVSSAGED